MALVPMGQKGNFVHVYDFRVKPGTGDEFIRLFDAFDYSDDNPMHKSPAQAKDGILCRDVDDPDHFWLLGEWKDIAEHKRILVQVRALEPEFVKHVEGGAFVPRYGEIVSSTPQHVLDRAAR